MHRPDCAAFLRLAGRQPARAAGRIRRRRREQEVGITSGRRPQVAAQDITTLVAQVRVRSQPCGAGAQRPWPRARAVAGAHRRFRRSGGCSRASRPCQDPVRAPRMIPANARVPGRVRHAGGAGGGCRGVLVVTALAIGSRLADWWWPGRCRGVACPRRAGLGTDACRWPTARGKLYGRRSRRQPGPGGGARRLGPGRPRALSDARAKGRGRDRRRRRGSRCGWRANCRRHRNGIDAVEASLRDGETGRPATRCSIRRRRRVRPGRLDGDDAAALPLWRRRCSLCRAPARGRDARIRWPTCRPAHAALVAGDLGADGGGAACGGLTIRAMPTTGAACRRRACWNRRPRGCSVTCGRVASRRP